METIFKVQSEIAAAQAKLEEAWPFPSKHSMFNLSVRDLLATILIFVAIYAVLHMPNLSFPSKVMLLASAAAAEPAMLALPYNVLHALIHRSPRFWDPLVVEPMLQHLLDHFGDLQREAVSILHENTLVDFSAVNPFQRRIALNQPWKVFPFFSYGKTHEENCKKAPITSSILQQIPSVRLAMYSVMSKGANIPTHCGFFKSSLRVHLTLVTDYEDVSMQRYIDVGGQTYSWKMGEMVAFDDTYPHKVINNVEGKRVVLFLDVDRPYADTVSRVLGRCMTLLMHKSPNVTRLAAEQERSSHGSGLL